MDYSPPVDQLLRLGHPGYGDEWRDYSTLGLTPEHVPDLIRMATDAALHNADGSSPLIWAPLHAWRALGQLKAAEATRPLVQLLRSSEAEDWILDEVPAVLGMIGPPAIPALTDLLAEREREYHVPTAAVEAFGAMASEHPETKPEVVRLLTRQLEAAEENSPELNGFLISQLVHLRVAEAAPVIERAFTAGRVDESIVGSWGHVAYDLGLTDTPPPRPRYDLLPPLGLPPVSPRLKTAKQKAKARRKQAKASRKRNRKKKQ